MHHRVASLLALVAFAAGGVVAPVAHRAHHTAEAGAARVEHAAAGHHHHDRFGAHGLEWTPACDRPVPLDELTCVLCKGLQAADLTAASGCDVLAAERDAVTVPSLLVGAARAGGSRVRGPPHRIA